MEAAGETSYGLAKKSHVPRPTIDRKIGGGAPFNVDELEAIAKALGLVWTDLTREDAA
jgi:hypothetical protein